MSAGDESTPSQAPRRNHIGRIPSDPPPGLPTHTPYRRPKSWRSRVRRWFWRTLPEVWTFATGNSNARHGRPVTTALYILLVLIALGVTALLVLLDNPQ